MISKKIREEFEANYPMPFACGWNSMTSEYECIWPEHAGEPDTEVPILEHNDRLAVWIKSRESMVIELPASPYIPDSEPESMTGYEIGEAQGRCDMWASVRESIEAAGLKVKP